MAVEMWHSSSGHGHRIASGLFHLAATFSFALGLWFRKLMSSCLPQSFKNKYYERALKPRGICPKDLWKNAALFQPVLFLRKQQISNPFPVVLRIWFPLL